MDAIEVFPLLLADVKFPEGHPEAGAWGPVFAYAIVRGGDVVVFDTGVGEGEPEIDHWYTPVRRSLVEELSGHGLNPNDAFGVVNSHLHFDHCGQNALFPGTPILVQASERAAAREPDYTVSAWVGFPGARYESLDGDTEILSGVRVLSTPGHTPGHQSMLLDTAPGPTLLAGQAVYTAEEWGGSEDPRRSGASSAWDPKRYAVSVRRLRDLDPHRVMFSHDQTVWERT